MKVQIEEDEWYPWPRMDDTTAYSLPKYTYDISDEDYAYIKAIDLLIDRRNELLFKIIGDT